MPRITLTLLGIVLLAGACGSGDDPNAEIGAPSPSVTTTVQSQEQSPLSSWESDITAQVYSEAQPVDVLIATDDIPAGTPWDRASWDIDVAQVPLKIRPTTFVSEDNADTLRGLVARDDIPRNQIIVAGLFVVPTVARVSPTTPIGASVVQPDESPIATTTAPPR